MTPSTSTLSSGSYISRTYAPAMNCAETPLVPSPRESAKDAAMATRKISAAIFKSSVSMPSCPIAREIEIIAITP